MEIARRDLVRERGRIIAISGSIAKKITIPKNIYLACISHFDVHIIVLRWSRRHARLKKPLRHPTS
jgi:hypothetical protein